jgi:hypothetical protein
MNWTTETLRSGVAIDTAYDHRRELASVPGTWYRVRQGDVLILTTRNRGDALRRFQRTASSAYTAPKCGPKTVSHTAGGGLTYLYCTAPAGHAGKHTTN